MGELGNRTLDTVSGISQKSQATKNVMYHPNVVTSLAGYLGVDGEVAGMTGLPWKCMSHGNTISRDETHPQGFLRNYWGVGLCCKL